MAIENFKVVALSNLNLREGPGESFEIINQVPGGYTMTVTQITKDGGNHRWYKTNVNNGWVKAVYVAQPNMSQIGTRVSSERNVAGGFPSSITNFVATSATSIISGIGVGGALGKILGPSMSTQERILSRRIYGVPHQFIESTDGRPDDGGPFGLEFITNIMAETPILSILPGVPDYLAEMTPAEKDSLTKDLAKAVNEAAEKAQIEALDNKDMDVRFFEFLPRCMEYMTYVNVLCRMAAIFMGIQQIKVPGHGTGAFSGGVTDWLKSVVGNTDNRTDGQFTYGEYNWFRWHLSNAYAGQVAPGGDFTQVGKEIMESVGNVKDAAAKKAKEAAGAAGKAMENVMGGGAIPTEEEIGGDAKVMKDEDATMMNQLDNASGSRFYMDSYYIDFFIKPPSYSETFSNQTSQSMFAGAIQSASNMAKELQFFLGGAMSLDSGKFNEQIGDYKKNMDALIGKAGSNESVKKIMSSLITGSTSVITGANLIFPEIWESSAYNRDFSMEITLATPYGTRESVFLNIIVPLMHLLAFVLPRQTTVNSYSAPFLVRCTVPGFFSCDMGIVRDMTITKGGPNGDAWTKDGLPTEVTVTLNISDLYNALAMNNYRTGRNMWNFLWNAPLLDYVGVASGLNMRSSNYAKKLAVIGALTANALADQYDYSMGSLGEQAAIARTRILGAKG